MATHHSMIEHNGRVSVVDLKGHCSCGWSTATCLDYMDATAKLIRHQADVLGKPVKNPITGKRVLPCVVEQIGRAIAYNHFNRRQWFGACTKEERTQWLVDQYWERLCGDIALQVYEMTR